MSRTIDELIKRYNRNIRISRHAMLSCKGKSYSDHVTSVDKIIDNAMDLYNDVSSDVKAINELEQSNSNKENSASVREYYEKNKIVSPYTYSKISSYYKRHKGKRYYNTYKVDKELHRFLMELGEYLERLDSRTRTRNGRIYSIASEENNTEAGNSSKIVLYDILSNISEKFVKIGLWLTAAAHATYPVVGPLAVRSPYMFLLLKIIAVVDAITNVMVPLGAVIHPDRKANIKKFIRSSRVELGLYKNIGYSLYINYIYKLYGLLNSVMSIVKNIYEYLSKNINVPIDQIGKNFKEKIEKEAGIKQKNSFLRSIIKFVSRLFKSNKSKIEELNDILSIDENHLIQLVTLIDEKRDQLNMYTYVIRFSDPAAEKINAHYGENIQISNNTLTFKLKYPGGQYYKPVEVLDKSELEILGSNVSKEEAGIILAGCMTLADELIITQIGDLKFEAGIIKIDLKELRWLAFTKRSSWEGFLDKILKRDTKGINKDNIGFIIFESFNNLIKRGQKRSKSS
jgi:hypothetical protein